MLQGIANVVWSFGRLRHPADALVAAMAPQVGIALHEPQMTRSALCSVLQDG